MVELELDQSDHTFRLLNSLLSDLTMSPKGCIGSLTALFKLLRGHSLLVGDKEHCVYMILGFISAETTKHAMRNVAYGLSFHATSKHGVLKCEARLAPSNRHAGSVAFGILISRIGLDRFCVSNP